MVLPPGCCLAGHGDHADSPEKTRSGYGGFPDALRFIPLTLNGYGRGRRLQAQEYVTDGNVEPLIERLLVRPDIDYIHVRNSEAGCYILRIERADTTGRD